MAHSVNDHLEKAQKNKEFADSIVRQSGTATGWALTVLFYSALHFIQAFLVSKGTDIADHKRRDEAMRRMPELSEIYTDYRDLLTLSKNARYEMNEYGDREFAEAEESLSAVRDHVRTLLERVTGPATGERLRDLTRVQRFVQDPPRPMPGRPIR